METTMYKPIRTCGWLLSGLALAFLAGCHDDDKKVRYHEDRPQARHTAVNVDVAVARPERRAYVEPAEPEVIDEGGPEAVAEPPPPAFVLDQPPETVVVDRRPVVIVHQPPPAVIVERRPPPPPGLTVWIDGCWHVEGHRFVWARGHYEHERKGHHFEQPRWQHGRRGWEFHEGHWK
jgi:hypothetical protein